MKVIYEQSIDVVTIRFLPEGTPVTSEVVDEDLILDFAADGRLAAIEVLSASKRLDLSSLQQVAYQAIGDEE